VFPVSWDSVLSVDRSTKCFSPQTNRYPGGFPVGFLSFLQERGWWGDKRLHIPCGQVRDMDSIRVDIQPPPKTNATHVFDATLRTNYPEEWKENFDFVLIDKPYSEELARSLYGTEDNYAGLDRWVGNCAPLVKPGGLLVTLDYQYARRASLGPEWNLIGCWGIYQSISVSNVRLLQVWKRDGERSLQGLSKWGV